MDAIEPSPDLKTHIDSEHRLLEVRVDSADADDGLELFPEEEPARSPSVADGSLIAIVAAGPPAAPYLPTHSHSTHHAWRFRDLASAINAPFKAARRACVVVASRVHAGLHALASDLSHRFKAAGAALAVAALRVRAFVGDLVSALTRRLRSTGSALAVAASRGRARRQDLASTLSRRLGSARALTVAAARASLRPLVMLAMFVAVAAATRYAVVMLGEVPSDIAVVAESQVLAAVARMPLTDLRPSVREVRASVALPSEQQRPAELQRIQRVLNRYRDAFSVLDARGAKSVWPTVDANALAARFARLVHQNYDFDSCGIKLGVEDAAASCRGLIEYQTVGSPAMQREPHAWHFSLRKVQDDWFIASVDPR